MGGKRLFSLFVTTVPVFWCIPIDQSGPFSSFVRLFTRIRRKKMITKRVLTVFSLLMIVSFALAPMSSAQDEEKIKLTILTHWGEERLLTAQQALLDEYTASHPNVSFELITVPFEELYTKITTMRTAGESPDIYHLYNLWLPEFVTSDMMSTPPASIVDAVVANTSPGVVEGTTFDGQVWGYPTEVNTYLLLYNKRLLARSWFQRTAENLGRAG